MPMATNAPDPNASRPSALQAMLARLRGMIEEPAPAEAEEEVLPAWDPPATENAALSPPLDVPLAQPVALDPVPAEGARVETESEPEEPPPIAPVAPRLCPLCHSPRRGDDSYCSDCGIVFPEEDPIPVAQKVAAKPNVRLKGRYELKEFLSERSGVARYRGLDFAAGDPG